jgi:hypothetical protein
MINLILIIATLVGTAIVVVLDDAQWDRKKPKK